MIVLTKANSRSLLVRGPAWSRNSLFSRSNSLKSGVGVGEGSGVKVKVAGDSMGPRVGVGIGSDFSQAANACAKIILATPPARKAFEPMDFLSFPADINISEIYFTS